MSVRALPWLGRMVGVTIFALIHLGILMGAVTANIGGMLARGPHGEELGGVYRESPEGRRNSLIIAILEWPLVKPAEIIRNHLPGEVAGSLPWRLAEEANFFANSLVWGAAAWLLLELLARGLSHPFRRS